MQKEYILAGIEPAKVMEYFEEITRIPHGSGNTKAISEYLSSWAEKQGLRYVKEPCGNVIVYGDATSGYEQKPGVILQGHMDMVAVKETSCDKNLETEGLSLFVDGNLIGATGTSLGGDDGIALAYAMAILSDATIPHPAITFIATIDEETGMDGAMALVPAHVTMNRLINLDSEEEGVFTVGCAGGATLRLLKPIRRTGNPFGKCYEICVYGLQGGHSGTEIDKNRANAILLLGRVLRFLKEKQNCRVICINGGTKDNAIPTEARAVISASAEPELKQIEAELCNAFSGKEEGLKIGVSETEAAFEVMTEETEKAVIDLLSALPFGVSSMSVLPGLVETSNNIGIITTTADCMEVAVSVRSMIESEKEQLCTKIGTIASLCGFTVSRHGEYPGWQYREDSALREQAIAAFKAEYGREPRVETIHAGLECGLFCKKISSLDAISMGPNIYDIHTTKERLDIVSVQRTWRLLLRMLAEK